MRVHRIWRWVVELDGVPATMSDSPMRVPDRATPMTSTTSTHQGTPSSTTYLRGDGVWSTPPGGGGGGTVSSEDITDTAVGGPDRRGRTRPQVKVGDRCGTSNLALGSSEPTACPGDDERLSDARPRPRTPSGSGHHLGTVGYARLPVGTAANTVAAGNDSRFTDTRTPTGQFR